MQGPPVQAALYGILMASLAEDVCSFVPTWMWFGNTASPALYCRGSEPARPFLGVLSFQNFFQCACGFECTVGQKRFMQSLGAHSFLSYSSIHSN